MEKIVSLLLCVICSVSGEVYQLKNLSSGNRLVDTFDKQSERELDTLGLSILSVGSLGDINATTDTCQLVGAGIRCDVETTISSGDGDEADLRIQVDCPLDSQTVFDFRRAVGCSCGAAVTYFNGTQKFCPCIVCPLGFGNSPIFIDCSMREDPYIISTCTSMDCAFGCNGTCAFNCEQSGPSCTFCKNNRTPTQPAGDYGGGAPVPKSVPKRSPAMSPMGIAGGGSGVRRGTLGPNLVPRKACKGKRRMEGNCNMKWMGKRKGTRKYPH